MITFWPIQQDLDCVNENGQIVGKIKFDGNKDEYHFLPSDASVEISDQEKRKIAEKLVHLNIGKHTIPMQDDD